MKVKWTERALGMRKNIADYIGRQFDAKRRTRFLQEVRNTTQLLRKTPYIGAIDPYYSDRTFTYRSIIVNGLNKMVYRIDGDFIYIVDFWDTRREPQRQASKTE